MKEIPKRPDWYTITVDRFSRYQKHSSIADSLREEVENLQPRITRNFSLTPKQAGLSDNTVLDAGKHIDNEVMYHSHDNENQLLDFAISKLSLEKQFIVRKRFVEGRKDQEVIKLLDNGFGGCGAFRYRRLRDEAVDALSFMLGHQKIEIGWMR